MIFPQAFHVFKIFVANPRKPQTVLDILNRNQPKLIKLLENFIPNRWDGAGVGRLEGNINRKWEGGGTLL